MKTLADVDAYLKADSLKYVVHLKMLTAYPEHMIWHGEQVGDQTGVMLLLPTSASPFDAKMYPDSDWVVLLAADGVELAERLVQRLPREKGLVFKLVDELTRAAVLGEFPARRVTTYRSYTTYGGPFSTDPAVVVSSVLDERLLSCYQANGYTLPELTHYFHHGAMSFSLYAGEPLSTCMMFPNYEQIWEVGGVYTTPEHRRMGLAKKVVTAAISTLLGRGKIPRYQVRETNEASIRLAESLGLERFVTTEHYIYKP